MKPTSEAELAEAVASAKGPLRIVGGGTRQGLGHPVAGEVLETSGLSGITLYEPGALTLVAKAGTPLAEIEATLANDNQRLAFEPMDHRGIFGTSGAPTIGAIAACNISGPRRIQSGACRDHMLGVRFVDGLGNIVKNGGRVMKNVTGYDLVKLMAGSYGTLGVLSEVSFKVQPKPETQATLLIHGLASGNAGRAMNTAMGTPYDVSGAAHIPGEDSVTMIRIEGFENSVAYRSEMLKEELAGFGGEISLSEDATVWQQIRDVSHLPSRGYLWRVSMKPSDGPRLTDALAQSLGFKCSYDWAGGLVWIQCSKEDVIVSQLQENPNARDAITGAAAMQKALREFVANESEGHVTLIRGPDALKAQASVFQAEAETLRRISQGFRDKFDPKGILNSGLMG